IFCATLTALIAAGIVIDTIPANAQQASEEQTKEVIDEIIEVEAPIERSTETIALKRQVSFADLDLSKHSDVIELEKRVEIVAKEACEKLEEMYPF
ncbi:MAG: UrcA family protein, partial [Candidatus Latescibacteria bacterium]|nr:UrcA family protein [Candidatus Latescibacterota bacterium]NIO77654.1 UrcA family protein [Candidatus Latescibacterota bacterium]